MGISRKSSDGVIYHSDDDGNYTGASRPTLGGRYVDYDKDGNVVGYLMRMEKCYKNAK